MQMSLKIACISAVNLKCGACYTSAFETNVYRLNWCMSFNLCILIKSSLYSVQCWVRFRSVGYGTAV